jgi:LPXTG-motif cell wall-anchored protein
MKAPIRRTFLAAGVVLLVMIQLTQAAFADTTITLLPEHVGATNPGFVIDKKDCGPNPTGAFMWRFALVWIDRTTPPGVLTARFAKAGVVHNSSPVLFGGGNEQKFWVYTDAPDTLLGASAVVSTAQSGKPRAPALKLSGVQHGCKPPPPPVATAGVILGACAFSGAVSETPTSISVSPPGGATVTLRDENGRVVSVTSSSRIVRVVPGTFRWSAVPAAGRTLATAASGTVSVAACPPKPAVLPNKLPRTGAPLGALTAIGLVLLGAGGLMVTSDRRRPLGPTRRAWRLCPGSGDAAAWLLRMSLGRVIAVSRGGVWVLRVA